MSKGEAILDLFGQLASRDEEVKELRVEKKDAIAQFCEEHEEFTPKAINDGYRFFKQLAKDKSDAVDAEFQRDKIIELLIGSNTETE